MNEMRVKTKEFIVNFFRPQGIFDKKFVKKPLMLYLVFGILLSLIPVLQEQGIIQFYTTRVFGIIIIYAVVALGLNLLLGFSGLISLGTAGFMGFGAYGLPYFQTTLGISFIGATIITLIVAALIGALIGLFSLKVEGVYLAIATLFVGEIFLELFKNIEWFTNGFSGVNVGYPSIIFMFVNLTGKLWQLVLVFAVLAALIGTLVYFVRKKVKKDQNLQKDSWIIRNKSLVKNIIVIAGVAFILLLLTQWAIGESIITKVPSHLAYARPRFRPYLIIIEFDRSMTFNLLVVFLILSMFVIYNIVHSRTGRALMAMSRSEHAAQAMGISLLKYRLVAFMTATIFATLAGCLYAAWIPQVDPTPWTLSLSLTLIAIVVVGGFKSIFGMFVGAYVIHGISTFYLKEYFGQYNGLPYIFSGLLIILVVLFYPYGAVYLWHDLKQLFKKIIKLIKNNHSKQKEGDE